MDQSGAEGKSQECWQSVVQSTLVAEWNLSNDKFPFFVGRKICLKHTIHHYFVYSDPELFVFIAGGSRKRPHPASGRSRSSPAAAAASSADGRGQQSFGKTHPATASAQLSSTDTFYHPVPGRPGHDTPLDPQYGSAGSMDHPYGDHSGPSQLQANYTSSPYLYRDHSGVHNAPPHKHHKALPPYTDLNRMSPIPEVGYHGPSRTASYSAPKSGPVINLHSTNSYRDPHRQNSDTVVWWCFHRKLRPGDAELSTAWKCGLEFNDALRWFSVVGLSKKTALRFTKTDPLPSTM